MKRFNNWIRQEGLSLLIGLLGVALLFCAHVTEDGLKATYPTISRVLGHIMEELGGVLVVGMLVRVAIEEGYQEKFLGSVSKEVKESIDRVSREAVEPISRELANAGRSISILDGRLSSASEQINHLSSALTYKVIQNLEPEFRKVLEDKVLNSPFVRPDFKLTIRLSPYVLPDASCAQDLVSVYMNTSYTIRNQTESTSDFPCVFWLDDMIRPAGHRECDYTRFAYGKVDKNGVTNFYPRADLVSLEKDGYITLDKSALRLSYMIRDIDAGVSYGVVVDGKTVMRANDVLIWSMATLTNRLDLTILLEGGFTLKVFDVVTQALHHADAVTKKVSDTEIRLSLDQVFLPYQGVEVRWIKRANANEYDSNIGN